MTTMHSRLLQLRRCCLERPAPAHGIRCHVRCALGLYSEGHADLAEAADERLAESGGRREAAPCGHTWAAVGLLHERQRCLQSHPGRLLIACLATAHRGD